MSKQKKIPASYRYNPFFDLLADAAFQHRQARDSGDSFAATRYARASIVSSSLCIECTANCLLDQLDVPKSLREELDKLPPIAKIDVATRLLGKPSFERSRHEVSQAAELVRARNDYVHPKSTSWRATVHEMQDAGKEWMLPFVMHGESWKSLGIPKQSPFWTSEASLAVLKLLAGFLKYVFVDVLNAEEHQIDELLVSRLEFGNVLVPGIFDEFMTVVLNLKDEGVDFSFLRIGRAGGAAQMGN